jgi:hypothetical protein
MASTPETYVYMAKVSADTYVFGIGIGAYDDYLKFISDTGFDDRYFQRTTDHINLSDLFHMTFHNHNCASFIHRPIFDDDITRILHKCDSQVIATILRNIQVYFFTWPKK